MDSYFSGEFTKNKSKLFLDALRDIQKIKVQQVLFHINKKTKDIDFYTVNDGNTIMSIVNIKNEVFKDFEFETDFVFGIYDLHEFVSLISIFDGDFKFEMNKSVCEISNKQGNVKYYAAEQELIREGKKEIKAAIDWYTEFDFDKDQYSSFIKAVPVVNGKFIIFQGKKGEKKISIQVKDKDMSSSNSFNINVDVEANEKDFKQIIDKDNFMNVISGSSEVFKVQIGNIVTCFSGETDGHKVKTFISPRVD